MLRRQAGQREITNQLIEYIVVGLYDEDYL